MGAIFWPGSGALQWSRGRCCRCGRAGATDLPQFRTELDTGLCCASYFEAHSLPAFEAAGLAPKSLENRRICVRGFIEARSGPRIELLRVGQVEVLGGN